VRRPSPTGYCLTPTAELAKTERGPVSMSGPSIFSMSPNQAIPAEKSICCSFLAAVGPLTILSWPEALNASRSRRACRMAIRRNACSLLALPDFPEFAQAVRYGVPGTPQEGRSSHQVLRELRPSFQLAEEMVARLGAGAIMVRAVRPWDVDVGPSTHRPGAARETVRKSSLHSDPRTPPITLHCHSGLRSTTSRAGIWSCFQPISTRN